MKVKWSQSESCILPVAILASMYQSDFDMTKASKSSDIFFFYLGFLSLNIQELQDIGERWRLFLTSICHFHMLQRYLDFSRAIAAESSTLHMAIAARKSEVTNHYAMVPHLINMDRALS